jgi:peptidoglycan hydrolase CwlO-like protein
LVHAEPSSAELKQTTSALRGELNSLHAELNALSSEMDELSKKIEESKTTMEEIQVRMDEAQKKGEEQYEAMKLRIKHMYEAGDYNFLEILCTAENMSDFLNKTDYIKTISEYDRDMLEELRNTQEEIRKEGEELEKEQEKLEKLKEELTKKCTAIQQKIASTSGELSQYQDLLDRVQAAENAANSSNSSKPNSGSTNKPSSPEVKPPTQSTEGAKYLGSFKITHYCSCYYCSGGWGNSTASGAIATVGRTIAVDPKVIPLGSKVIINGYVYVAEDTGGAIKGNKIDIYVKDHQTALNKGVYYTDVYLAK